MPKPVTAEFRGNTLNGVASDMHAMFAAALLMPDYAEVIKKESGLFESFRKFSAEQSAMMAIAGTDAKDTADRMSEMWAERVLIRLNHNEDIESRFASRMKEVFPDLPPDAIDYQVWYDDSGKKHVATHVCLDMKEVMELIAPLVTALIDDVPKVAAEPPVQGEIAKLKAQLASMEKNFKEQNKPQGFAKTIETTAEA